MKNVIILGFGRSGTSLIGGILHNSEYFLGDNLYPPRESNPKGFFENAQINGINEKILSDYDYIKISKSSELFSYRSSPYNPIYGQRWLSYIESKTAIECHDLSVLMEIKTTLSVPIFAYKDPRFNYTLPVWAQYLPENVVFICMFRQPEVVVESVLKDCYSKYNSNDFFINREIIFKLWYNSYQRVLGIFSDDLKKQIVFIHYEQLLSKEILPQLSITLDTNLDDRFIAPYLNRSRSTEKAPLYVVDLYNYLCKLSDFSLG